MAEAKLYKVVAALPGTLEANSVYFVRVGTGIDIYATNDTGTVVAFKHNTIASGNSGVATVDFGSGKGIASVDVVGQIGITSQTPVFAQIALRYTDQHSPDEAMIEQVDVRTSTPSSDTGFTIYLVSRFGMLFGKYDVYWNWR